MITLKKILFRSILALSVAALVHFFLFGDVDWVRLAQFSSWINSHLLRPFLYLDVLPASIIVSCLCLSLVSFEILEKFAGEHTFMVTRRRLDIPNSPWESVLVFVAPEEDKEFNLRNEDLHTALYNARSPDEVLPSVKEIETEPYPFTHRQRAWNHSLLLNLPESRHLPTSLFFFSNFPDRDGQVMGLRL